MKLILVLHPEPLKTTCRYTFTLVAGSNKKEGWLLQTLDALLGTDKTDKDSPGLAAKGYPTENDKENKGILIGGIDILKDIPFMIPMFVSK